MMCIHVVTHLGSREYMVAALSHFESFLRNYVFLEGSASERRQSSRASRNQVMAGYYRRPVASVRCQHGTWGNAYWYIQYDGHAPRPTAPELIASRTM